VCVLLYFYCVQTCALPHVEDEDVSACLFRTALDHAGIAVSQSVNRVSDTGLSLGAQRFARCCGLGCVATITLIGNHQLL
jgi:hypothetical protein